MEHRDELKRETRRRLIEELATKGPQLSPPDMERLKPLVWEQAFEDIKFNEDGKPQSVERIEAELERLKQKRTDAKEQGWPNDCYSMQTLDKWIEIHERALDERRPRKRVLEKRFIKDLSKLGKGKISPSIARERLLGIRLIDDRGEDSRSTVRQLVDKARKQERYDRAFKSSRNVEKRREL